MTEMSRNQAWSVMWTVSTAAGMSVFAGMLFAAVMRSAVVALVAFLIGFTVIAGAGLALVPVWRRTAPR
jgi:hypothetical protein